MKKYKIKQIKKLREEGETIQAIANTLNISVGTVSYWLYDEKRELLNKERIEKFRNKPLEERQRIYKQRLPYLRNWQKNKYNSDKLFREKKKKDVNEHYKKMKGGNKND